MEKIEVYQVELGGLMTTTNEIARMLREADLYVSGYVTQANFPLNPREIEIIDPGRSFGEDEGLAFLKIANLGRPTEEHALRFTEQHGKTTTGEKPYIIFLHEPWKGPSDDDRLILYVDRESGMRGLDLGHPHFGFDSRFVLAGVHPSSPR